MCIRDSYLDQHLNLLQRGGRLVLIDSITGDFSKIDLGTLIVKNLKIMGSVLRPRPLHEKAVYAQEIEAEWIPILASGRIRPHISHRFNLAEAQKAHEIMESRSHSGKIVLVIEGKK